MKNKNLLKGVDCNKHKCLINWDSESCDSSCEIENGYCIYEEMEFIRELKFDTHIEESYPGETMEEKYNHYYYDCFEREENLGSCYDFEDEFENETEKCPIELTERYYSEIYFNIHKSELFIKEKIRYFNEESIRDFKVWFRDQFVYGIDIQENDHLKYKWSNDFTIALMNLSLIYLDDQYALHKVGGWSPDWVKLEMFLESVANEPFEAELFELIEGDAGVFEDEN
jgi:hypothetical protein